MNIPTTGDVVLNVIKDFILTGKILPGDRLNIDAMSRQLNISKTPIREALKKLEQENLVLYYPRVGWKVLNMSKLECLQIYEVQELLETYICSQLKDYFDNIDIDMLIYYNNELNLALENKEYRELLTLNEKFHMEIYKVYPNNFVLNMLQNVWNCIKVQRNKMLNSQIFINTIDFEHNDIIKSIKNKDVKNLVLAQKIHFDSGRKVIENI